MWGNFKEAGYRELTEACNKYQTPLKDGSAVITNGFNLKNQKYIIHAVGPDFNSTPKAFKELYDAYYNSFLVLKENNLHSISMPLISSGIFGGNLDDPVYESSKECFRAYKYFIKNYQTYDITVYLCAYTKNEYDTVLKCEKDFINNNKLPNNKAKVVIIAGNKRAGKTTLAIKLHKKYNYNYYSFDNLLDSLEYTFEILYDHNDDKYINLLNELVKRSLNDATNYGISSVYDYIFTPEQLNKFLYTDQVEIFFLANLDANEKNIRSDMKEYSKSFDWPLTAPHDDIERNVKEILNKNELLKKDCKKYGYRLINTSRGTSREKILDDLADEIANK